MEHKHKFLFYIFCSSVLAYRVQIMSMGNNSSQPEHVAQQRSHVEEQKWTTTSFPRSPDTQPHRPKVLLHRDFYQKLRPTNNGEILQSGGTLTGRYRQNRFLYKNGNVVIT